MKVLSVRGIGSFVFRFLNVGSFLLLEVFFLFLFPLSDVFLSFFVLHRFLSFFWCEGGGRREEGQQKCFLFCVYGFSDLNSRWIVVVRFFRGSLNSFC